MAPTLSFDRHGPAVPHSPVVLSVPHAGRDYPAAMLPRLRVTKAALIPLEDRYVDALALAVRGSATLFVQRRARAWIDLNRGEQDRDPKLDDGAPAPARHDSAKLRSGLGLIPRRLPGSGDIWHGRLSDADVRARIEADHRPYHAALGAALASARARFGIAVLVDIHSMPPLTGPDSAQIVLGDRFGRAAAARFIARVEAEADAAGIRHALNTPYAGGHILERHGARARNVHAVQIEFDRRLYLDAALDQPGAGLDATARLLARMIESLADEALASGTALAAE